MDTDEDNVRDQTEVFIVDMSGNPEILVLNIIIDIYVFYQPNFEIYFPFTNVLSSLARSAVKKTIKVLHIVQ